MVEKKAEFNTTMSIEEFSVKLLQYNNLGRELTLKHKELYGHDQKDEKNNKGGRRFHPPGIKNDCIHCKQIIEAHDKYMDLQASQIGMTGIPFESLMSAIKVTRATIKMMKIGGELK